MTPATAEASVAVLRRRLVAPAGADEGDDQLRPVDQRGLRATAVAVQVTDLHGRPIEGAKLITREEWNQGYYGNGATPEAIVIERRFSNPQSVKLRDALP